MFISAAWPDLDEMQPKFTLKVLANYAKEQI